MSTCESHYTVEMSTCELHFTVDREKSNATGVNPHSLYSILLHERYLDLNMTNINWAIHENRHCLWLSLGLLLWLNICDPTMYVCNQSWNTLVLSWRNTNFIFCLLVFTIFDPGSKYRKNLAPPVFETRLANGLWMHIAAANGSGRAEFNLAPASDSACLQQPGKLEGNSFWENYESKS